MVKPTQTIFCKLLTNCLSVPDYFVGLALKGLKTHICVSNCTKNTKMFINIKIKVIGDYLFNSFIPILSFYQSNFILLFWINKPVLKKYFRILMSQTANKLVRIKISFKIARGCQYLSFKCNDKSCVDFLIFPPRIHLIHQFPLKSHEIWSLHNVRQLYCLVVAFQKW